MRTISPRRRGDPLSGTRVYPRTSLPTLGPVDPFALPCHPDVRITPQDRDWRAIGVKSADEVVRKQTRCPVCATSWTAFLRTVDAAVTVEWVRPTPFRVSAAPLPAGPVWQDEVCAVPDAPPADAVDLAGLVAQTAALGQAWERSVQVVTPVAVLTAGGAVFAAPGDLLLERREKWNAQDRRLALLWSPRLQRPVVAWHSFARLLQQ